VDILIQIFETTTKQTKLNRINSNRKEVRLKHFFLTIIILLVSGCSSVNSSLHVFEKCFESEILTVSDLKKNTQDNFLASISYFPIGEEFGEPEINLLNNSGFDGYILRGKEAWAIEVKRDDRLNVTGDIALKKSGSLALSVGLKDRYYLVVITDRGRYLFDAKIASPSILKSRVNDMKCLVK